MVNTTMNRIFARPRATVLHGPILAAALCASASSSAQTTLVVNDNDYITYNTDTLLSDLTAAGIVFDLYDVAGSGGVPPDVATLNAYDDVIWYCSTDGVGLGFWDATAQVNIVDRILNGRRTWIIGQDLLYAEYGAAPISFGTGDMPTDFLGVASYDVQSYGDDGNVGCPGMVMDPGVAGAFLPGFTWIFPTLWWVDGCTPTADADPIYAMGPAPYALEGAVSMLHFHPVGMNVMSTFFDPALIATYMDRVTFLQQTLAYMATFSSGVEEHPGATSMRIHFDASGNALLLQNRVPFRSITILDAQGRAVQRAGALPAGAHTLPFGRAAGIYTVVALESGGAQLGLRFVKP